MGSIFRFSLLTFSLICILSGCMPAPYFQKVEAVPRNAWAYNFIPAFTFDISDTNTTYQPYLIIRHTQAYPYCNLWIWLHIKTPGDTTTRKERINITLAEATGKWMGRGMGEIYEQRMPLTLSDSAHIGKAGTYTISLEQNMRINPLPEVLNVGLRVEKTGIRK
jgi:gliding motility-associated lipoprotein GldH